MAARRTPAPPATLAAAVAGDRRCALVALRDRLARDIDDCASMRDLAALSKRLMDVLGQLDDLDRAKPESKGTALDELTKRRAARGAGPAGRRRAQ